MPTLELEQRKVCDWIDEPRREIDLSSYGGTSSVVATSSLEESANTCDEVDPEQHVWDLARIARAKAAREHFDKVAALAAHLSITRSQLYAKALAEFVERHGEGLEGHADLSGAESDYWEISEYTDEEFNAILEADRLTPELAEHYKDLLGD